MSGVKGTLGTGFGRKACLTLRIVDSCRSLGWGGSLARPGMGGRDVGRPERPWGSPSGGMGHWQEQSGWGPAPSSHSSSRRNRLWRSVGRVPVNLSQCASSTSWGCRRIRLVMAPGVILQYPAVQSMTLTGSCGPYLVGFPFHTPLCCPKHYLRVFRGALLSHRWGGARRFLFRGAPFMGRKLYVGNLAYGVNDGDLQQPKSKPLGVFRGRFRRTLGLGT
jgi:hypothetical protein